MLVQTVAWTKLDAFLYWVDCISFLQHCTVAHCQFTQYTVVIIWIKIHLDAICSFIFDSCETSYDCLCLVLLLHCTSAVTLVLFSNLCIIYSGKYIFKQMFFIPNLGYQEHCQLIKCLSRCT